MKKYIPLFVLILLLAAWLVFLDKTADFFIFGPPQQISSVHTHFQEVNFPSKDGSVLQGLYARAQKGKPTFLVFHGNKHNVYTFQDHLTPYIKQGFGALIFDYRGYGKSEGKSSEKNMYEDGLSALNYLMTKQLVSPQDIIVWGFSLGAAPALYTVQQKQDWPFKALILQSPFTNTTDMAYFMLANRYKDSSITPLFSVLLKPFLWDKNFDSVPLISQVKIPLLVGSSQQDTIIPWMITNALVAHAPEQKQVYVSPLGEHDNPLWFAPRVLKFVNAL